MIIIERLAHYLDGFLQCAQYKDYAPNGLQVEGRQTIRKLCTAVTASNDVIEQAAAWQADLLMVHHGYFWRGEDPVIKGMKRQRIANLIKHDMNLLAYHLPLDCHLELGNNACLAKILSINSPIQHAAGGTNNLLWFGQLAAPMSGKQLATHIQQCLGRAPLHISTNKAMIETVAWCSGGAQDFIVDAHQLGADAYLSGEVSERTYYQAKELGIDYYACGHHATERYGIQALGKHVAARFDLDYCFIDSDNPI